MIVTCPKCTSRFRVADDKVKPAGIKVRCGRCKVVFRIRPSGSGAQTPGAPTKTPPQKPKQPSASYARTPSVTDVTVVGPSHFSPPVDAHDDSKSGVDPAWGFPSSPDSYGAFDISEKLPQDVSQQPKPAGQPSASSVARPDPITGPTSGGFTAAKPRTPSGVQAPPVQPGASSPGVENREGLDGLHSGQIAAPDPMEPPKDPSSPQPVGDEFGGFFEPGSISAPRNQFPPPLPSQPAQRPPSNTWDPVPSSLPSAELSASLAAPPAGLPESPASMLPLERHAAEVSASHRALMHSKESLIVRPHHSELIVGGLASAVAVFAVLAVFFAYLAARNDWMLDFRQLDQMVAVAFKGHEFIPRHTRTVTVFDLDGELVERPAENGAVEDFVRLRIDDLEHSHYITRNQVPLVVIEGVVANGDDRSYRRIFVEGRLAREGEAVDVNAAPVGRSLSHEELEQITSSESIDGLYETLADNARGFIIQPDVSSRFTLVFVVPTATELDETLTYEVNIVRAERTDDAGAWRRLVFDPAYFNE